MVWAGMLLADFQFSTSCKCWKTRLHIRVLLLVQVWNFGWLLVYGKREIPSARWVADQKMHGLQTPKQKQGCSYLSPQSRRCWFPWCLDQLVPLRARKSVLVTTRVLSFTLFSDLLLLIIKSRSCLFAVVAYLFLLHPLKKISGSQSNFWRVFLYLHCDGCVRKSQNFLWFCTK